MELGNPFSGLLRSAHGGTARGVTVVPVRAGEEIIPFIDTPSGRYTPRQYFETQSAAGRPFYNVILDLAGHMTPQELAELLHGVGVDRDVVSLTQKTLACVVSEPSPDEFTEGAHDTRAVAAGALRGLEIFFESVA